MINIEIVQTKPIPVQIQENQSLVLTLAPVSGIIKGKDAYSPFINDAGNWECWDDSRSLWIDTGIQAQGIQGPPGLKGDKGDPGSDASVTVASIQAALGYLPVGETNHTHSYASLHGLPEIPTVPVQDIRVKGVSAVHNGIVDITRETILSLVDNGSEEEY